MVKDFKLLDKVFWCHPILLQVIEVTLVSDAYYSVNHENEVRVIYDNRPNIALVQDLYYTKKEAQQRLIELLEQQIEQYDHDIKAYIWHRDQYIQQLQQLENDEV